MSSSYDSALVDTAMIDDPRLMHLSRGVRLFAIEALVWAKLHKTDGLLPSGALLRRITDEPDADAAAALLAKAGLWEPAPGGWQIVGFTATQMDAARVQKYRDAARNRYDRWRNGDAKRRLETPPANGSALPRPAPPRPAREAGAGGGNRSLSDDPNGPTAEELAAAQARAATRAAMAKDGLVGERSTMETPPSG